MQIEPSPDIFYCMAYVLSVHRSRNDVTVAFVVARRLRNYPLRKTRALDHCDINLASSVSVDRLSYLIRFTYNDVVCIADISL